MVLMVSASLETMLAIALSIVGVSLLPVMVMTKLAVSVLSPSLKVYAKVSLMVSVGANCCTAVELLLRL